MPSPSEKIFANKMTFRQIMASRFLWTLVSIFGLVGIVVFTVAMTEFRPLADSSAVGETVASPLPVEVRTVEFASSYERIIQYTGTVDVVRNSRIGFERQARLISVSVDEGDSVSHGQILAQLDTRQLEIRQNDLNAQKSQAVAVLKELQTGPRKQTIAAARATVKELDAQVQLAKRTYDRQQRLFSQQAANQQNVDDAKFSLESMIAKRDTAQEQLDELEEGTRSEQIDAQQASVDRLDALLADVALDIEKSTLKAPFDGTIAERFLDEGTVVSPGEPVFRVVEDQALEVRIGLPVRSTANLKTRSAIPIQIQGREWTSTVKRLLPEVDLQTRTQTVLFTLDPEAAKYVVRGEIAQIELVESVASEGYWVPVTSMSPNTRGLWSVFVVVDGHVEDRIVEVLHTGTEEAFVRGTLMPGDQVIVSGTQRIVPGQAVAIKDISDHSLVQKKLRGNR